MLMKLYVGAVALLLVGSALSGCDRKGADAVSEEPVVMRELTPTQQMSYHLAQNHVLDAQYQAVTAMFRAFTRGEVKATDSARPEFDEKVRRATILFSANVHGEREDCGCRKNPLGGLTRRQRLIELAKSPGDEAAAKWWGEQDPTASTVFVADAGDLLFNNATLTRTSEDRKAMARHDAETVVQALNASLLDVVNVGELDLVFGLDALRSYAKQAKFPFVSANLRTKEGERPFPGHVVVERDKMRVAFVGLLKDKPRIKEYFEERGLRVEPAADAYLAELDAIEGDVDLVVMLSNLGLRDTRELVASLRARDARIDLAVVSNSNQLTRVPTFSVGVPIVEPLSRGKYFGRVDLWLDGAPGTPASYANAGTDLREVAREYRRAWSGYLSARRQRNHVLREITELALAEEGTPSAVAKEPKQADAKKQADAGALAAHLEEQKQQKLDAHRKRLEVLEKQIEVRSGDLLEAVSEVNAALPRGEAHAKGDDWVETAIVPVKLEIAQDEDVRAILDARAKTRPEPSRQKIVVPSRQNIRAPAAASKKAAATP